MPPKNTGPDFSKIDSLAKAQALYQRGELEKLFMMPLEYGGEDIALNILYVPIGIAAIKSRIDINVIGQLAEEGKVTRYVATPEYQGNSFIPIAIKIQASDPGNFETIINIWGDALSRE